MNTQIKTQLIEKLKTYYEYDTKSVNQLVRYGTAGFRGDAENIRHVFFKVGLAASLRCLKVNENVGLMITASHNPIQDNGVKMIDPEGNMLEVCWEQPVEELCNLKQPQDIVEALDKICAKFNITFDDKAINRKVLIGRDTRPSSESLTELVKKGIECWSPLVEYQDYGVVTTPVMHYLVAESNLRQQEIEIGTYFDQLVEGLSNIFETLAPPSANNYRNQLVIDCANGVGQWSLKRFLEYSKFKSCLNVDLINTGEGILNESCGADFVKATGNIPKGAVKPGTRYASLDGDADRLVYFYLKKNETGQMHLNLLDGDKILALFSYFFHHQLRLLGLEKQLTLGVVQTAFANGAATDYLLSKLNLEADMVKSGVKNLEAQAMKYDVGIFFEPNGHGTVWFSEKAKRILKETSPTCHLLKLINNYTGDAISDILLVETILRFLDWDIEMWDQIYKDRPISLTKLWCPNKELIQTKDADRICYSPPGIQEGLDALMKEAGPSARLFVRPSGTEDVIRMFAEAEDQQTSDKLAKEGGELVVKICSQLKTGSDG